MECRREQRGLRGLARYLESKKNKTSKTATGVLCISTSNAQVEFTVHKVSSVHLKCLKNRHILHMIPKRSCGNAAVAPPGTTGQEEIAQTIADA